MSACPRCGLRFSGIPPTQCPSCGALLGEPRHAGPSFESGNTLVHRYFSKVWMILAHPVRFFRALDHESGRIAQPLAFALVTHWIGAAIGFLWRALTGVASTAYFDRLFDLLSQNPAVLEINHPGRHALMLETKQRMMEWFWGVGSILADPFLTLFSILFTSFLVFLGTRLLISPAKSGEPHTIDFESALKVVCFGLTPAILAALPFVGGAAASVYAAIVTIIGVREYYRVGTGRATVVALFPKLLFLGILALGMIFLIVLLIKFVASAAV